MVRPFQNMSVSLADSGRSHQPSAVFGNNLPKLTIVSNEVVQANTPIALFGSLHPGNPNAPTLLVDQSSSHATFAVVVLLHPGTSAQISWRARCPRCWAPSPASELCASGEDWTTWIWIEGVYVGATGPCLSMAVFDGPTHWTLWMFICIVHWRIAKVLVLSSPSLGVKIANPSLWLVCLLDQWRLPSICCFQWLRHFHGMYSYNPPSKQHQAESQWLVRLISGVYTVHGAADQWNLSRIDDSVLHHLRCMLNCKVFLGMHNTYRALHECHCHWMPLIRLYRACCLTWSVLCGTWEVCWKECISCLEACMIPDMVSSCTGPQLVWSFAQQVWKRQVPLPQPIDRELRPRTDVSLRQCGSLQSTPFTAEAFLRNVQGMSSMMHACLIVMCLCKDEHCKAPMGCHIHSNGSLQLAREFYLK